MATSLSTPTALAAVEGVRDSEIRIDMVNVQSGPASRAGQMHA